MRIENMYKIIYRNNWLSRVDFSLELILIMYKLNHILLLTSNMFSDDLSVSSSFIMYIIFNLLSLKFLSLYSYQ